MKHALLLFFFLITTSLFRLEAQETITNIIEREEGKSSNPQGFTTLNGLFFFDAQTESEGREVWVSDGTADNTRLLKDIYPGNGRAIDPPFKSSAVILNDQLFFLANDGQTGKQLWATKGTEESTVRITNQPNIRTTRLTVVGDFIYFFTQENDLLTLWKSKGAAETTPSVVKTMPSRELPNFEGNFTDLFYFTFQSLDDRDPRVWRSDGTESGTFPVTVPLDGNGAGSGGTSHLTQYIEFQNELYVVVRSSAMFSYPFNVGIIKTDGAPENTVAVKAVHDGTRLLDFVDVIEVNGKLYFSFFEAEFSHLIIWESDGTSDGTTVVYDEASQNRFAPSNLSASGTNLVFTGKSSENKTALLKMNLDSYEVVEIKELIGTINSRYINFLDAFQINKINDKSFLISGILVNSEDKITGWFSDLSEANTVPIAELTMTREIVMHNKSVFFMGDSSFERELWKADLMYLQPALFKDINTSRNGLDFRTTQPIGDKIIFSASDSIFGTELWSYDNSSQAVAMVKDIVEGRKSSLPGKGVAHEDGFYFTAFNEERQQEVWRSDGTEVGTVTVTNFGSEVDFPRVSHLMVCQNRVFFDAFLNGRHFLCSTDSDETEVIKDLGETTNGFAMGIEETVATENYLFFTVDGDGHDLWRSDGTEEGTIKIRDFGSIVDLVAINNILYISASNNSSGDKGIWRSDGTEAGTVLVKEFNNDLSILPNNLVNFQGQLVFSAYAATTGNEYWISDGTSDGTQLIKDIRPGSDGAAVTTSYAALYGFLYFSANDGQHGVELWKTDGTTTGTALVQDINEGGEGSFPKEMKSNGEQIYFSAYSREGGVEPWSTKGTRATTNQLFDLISGPRGSVPTNFIFIDEEVFVIAETQEFGRQLWRLDNGAITGLTKGKPATMIQAFPNPTADFLQIRNGDAEYGEWTIRTLQGQVVLTGPARTDKLYVGDLPPGIYLLVGQYKGKKVVSRFIKR